MTQKQRLEEYISKLEPVNLQKLSYEASALFQEQEYMRRTGENLQRVQKLLEETSKNNFEFEGYSLYNLLDCMVAELLELREKVSQ